jgi:hypothetical protein
LDLEFGLNVLDAILIMGIAFPSLFIASRIRQRKLRILTMLLAGFLVLHGLYHITAALGGIVGLEFFGTISDLLVEPLGWLLFLSFAVYFARNS